MQRTQAATPRALAPLKPAARHPPVELQSTDCAPRFLPSWVVRVGLLDIVPSPISILLLPTQRRTFDFVSSSPLSIPSTLFANLVLGFSLPVDWPLREFPTSSIVRPLIKRGLRRKRHTTPLTYLTLLLLLLLLLPLSLHARTLFRVCAPSPVLDHTPLEIRDNRLTGF